MTHKINYVMSKNALCVIVMMLTGVVLSISRAPPLSNWCLSGVRSE